MGLTVELAVTVRPVPLKNMSLGCIVPATVADIINVMSAIAPPNLAEDWDNVGLQVGRLDWSVNRVWIALDPSPDVVSAACQSQVNLLITHHPLIFRPLNFVDFDSAIGSAICMAAKNKLAIFAAHTNFDSAVDGLNDILARRIGLSRLQPLVKSEDSQNDGGLGRVGEFTKPLDLKSFALYVKKKLGLVSLKVAGDLTMIISKVAVCTGSGSSLIRNFFSSGAQVFISGDLHYHDAKEALPKNLGLIDIGHFASEQLMIEVLAERLSRLLTDDQFSVTVEACRLEKDPFLSL
jgi:dinuclear metal center YbgI/SA1388 family protein